MQRRQLIASAAALPAFALLGLGGCATLSELPAQVRSFGDWPAGRAPGRYAFDRLPSQEADPDGLQRQLEDAARPALHAAGFQPAAAGAAPDVLVQLGAHVDRESAPWDDPLWWRGSGRGVWRHSPWPGPGWRLRSDPSRYERTVALLLRDRTSGKPLYEAHASHEGFSPDLGGVLQPLFAAAMQDFPKPQPQPHTVRVPSGR